MRSSDCSPTLLWPALTNLGDQSADQPTEVGEICEAGVVLILEKEQEGAFVPVTRTRTDQKGRYAFPGLAKGKYRLRLPATDQARLIGKSVHIAIAITPGITVEGLTGRKGEMVRMP